MTPIVGKSTPSPGDMDAWLRSPDTFIHCAMGVDGHPVSLARYQVAHLRDRTKFRVRQKARGVGFSWICAAEALAKAHLRDDYTGLFVSMNLEEAVEKIRYANQLYETIPLRWRKRKVVDNRTSPEFEDSTGRHRSRLISHPCKDPRGKHKADVFLDEFAHYGKRQRSIYVASVPIVSRGDGQLTIGSTPLAAGDLFHEIVTQERKKYPMFSRQAIPWWACPDLCLDVAAAEAEAPAMETEERVHRFGTRALIEVHDSLDEAEFQQEYLSACVRLHAQAGELKFLDESQTYFPYELIFGCVADGLVPCRSVDDVLDSTTGDLFAGFDVGRTRNTSELVVLERRPKRLVYRYGRSFDRSRFQEQEASLRRMLSASGRFKRLCIDQHGIGMNMADLPAAPRCTRRMQDRPGAAQAGNLRSEFGSRVEGLALVGQTKESLAVDLHIVMENEELSIPRDRELISQVHSIKKTATDAGYARYDTEGNRQAHADAMWSLALAVHAAGTGRKRKRRLPQVRATIV